MLNTFQKTTKSGKPIINKITKLPQFNNSITLRINKIKNEINNHKINITNIIS